MTTFFAMLSLVMFLVSPIFALVVPGAPTPPASILGAAVPRAANVTMPTAGAALPGPRGKDETMSQRKRGLGGASVRSHCDFPVYYSFVTQEPGSDPPVLPLPSRGFRKAFSRGDVGISLKLSTPGQSGIVQLEYTWDAKTDHVSYDLTLIDGLVNPFTAYGMEVAPDRPATALYPTCVHVRCVSGDAACEAAYNQPDDPDTKTCSEDTEITLTVCTDSGVAV